MAAITTLPAKRKRNQVNYLENDDELDELLGVATADGYTDDAQWDDDDTASFGTSKLPPNKLQKFKKAKISAPKRSSETTRKPFPFLALPAELRDYIYELAFCDPEGVTLVAKTKNYRRTVGRGAIPDNNGSWYRRRRRLAQRNQSIRNFDSQNSNSEPPQRSFLPALLAVNKQTHAEAINYLYQQPLVFEDTYALHSFIATIGSNRTRVTDITVKGWGMSRGTHKAMNFTSFTLLAGCTNLKSLFLDCNVGWLRNPKGLARQIYRDAVYFLEAYGTANGKKDAGIDVLELSEENYDNFRYSWRRDQIPEKDVYLEEFRAELRKLLGCKK